MDLPCSKSSWGQREQSELAAGAGRVKEKPRLVLLSVTSLNGIDSNQQMCCHGREPRTSALRSLVSVSELARKIEERGAWRGQPACPGQGRREPLPQRKSKGVAEMGVQPNPA